MNLTGPNETSEHRVLIVDDDLVVQQLLSRVIARQDRLVECVADGDSALARIGTDTYDLVLLDLGLPGASGHQILAHIKRDCPDTEVVVITGNTDVGTAVRAVQQGASDFLTKPLDFRKIQAVVERSLQSRELRVAASLAKAVQEVASTRDPEAVPGQVVRASLAALRAVSAALYRGPGSVLTVAAATDDKDAVALMGLAEAAVERGKGVRDRGMGRVGPGMAVLIQHHDEPMGVLAVRRRSGEPLFTRQDEERLGIIATEAAFALDRSQLVEDLRSRVDELSRARARLAAAEQLQSVGQLATMYAHELQSPLQYLHAHLRGALDALASGDNTGAEEAVRYAIDGAARVQDAVGDLSLLGRSRVESSVEIRRLVAVARRMAGDRGQPPIRVEVGEETVEGNVGHLVHALSQMLRNAMQASALIAEADEILIRASQEDGRVRVEVHDKGLGIPADVRARAFEPFFSTWGGNGLGLGIAREMVQANGGELTLENGRDAGVIAILDLPAEESVIEFALSDD